MRPRYFGNCSLLRILAAGTTLAILLLLAPAHEMHGQDKVYVVSYRQGSHFHSQVKAHVQHIYDIAGIPVRFVGLPHKRSLYAANSGEVDAEAGRVPSVEKRYPNLLRVDAKVMDLTGHAYVRSDSDIAGFSPALLDNLKVGIVAGVQWATNMAGRSLITEVSNYENLFRLLEYDRVDIILSTTPSAEVVLSGLGDRASAYRRLEPAASATPIYHYVNKKNAAIIPALTRAAKLYAGQRAASTSVPTAPPGGGSQ